MSSLDSSSSSSTGHHANDSSVDSGHIAAIIVCMLIGLVILCYAIYRLAKRYCPNMLLAITPQDSQRTLTRDATKEQSEYEQHAAEMAAHMAAADKHQQQQKQADKEKGDNHTVDMDAAAFPLSINEQWTVRDEAAHDEEMA